MKNRLKWLVLAALVSSSGCLPTFEEFPVSFSGTVTENGTPLAGAQISLFRPGVNGLPVLVDAMVTPSSGQYSVSTQIEERRCFLVVVEVEVTGPTGAQLYFDRVNADSCGDNTVDFDFT